MKKKNQQYIHSVKHYATRRYSTIYQFKVPLSANYLTISMVVGGSFFFFFFYTFALFSSIKFTPHIPGQRRSRLKKEKQWIWLTSYWEMFLEARKPRMSSHGQLVPSLIECDQKRQCPPMDLQKLYLQGFKSLHSANTCIMIKLWS